MIFSRLPIVGTFFACCVAFLVWLKFAPTALAIGGKLPPNKR